MDNRRALNKLRKRALQASIEQATQTCVPSKLLTGCANVDSRRALIGLLSFDITALNSASLLEIAIIITLSPLG